MKLIFTSNARKLFHAQEAWDDVMKSSLEDAGKGAELYERLRHDIVFGSLVPGSKLQTGKLREQYSSSVSTIREVLNRLHADGFAQSEGHRGYFVSDMTQGGLREIADLRILLECHALRLSFANANTEWESQVLAAHYKLSRMEQAMQAGDETVREKWKQFDWEFHKSLIVKCGSRELLRTHSVVFDKYLRYQMRVLTFRGDSASHEHKTLLDAALCRDAQRAVAVLRQHIDGGVSHSLEHWQFGK